jgi:hypothetical protein
MTSGSRYFLTDLYFSEWYINGRRRSKLAHFSNFFKKSFCHVELLEDPHEAWYYEILIPITLQRFREDRNTEPA